MKTLIVITIIVIAAVAFLAIGSKPEAMPRLSFEGSLDEVVSQEGVHYHPELTIVIKGQKQEIPADIGIGSQYKNNRFYDPMMNMTDIHTHDSSGTLHWEVMEGPTKKGHLRLGNFFEIWEKPFNANVKMLVNGEINQEFDNYLVKDEDRIEIIYE